MKSYKKYIDDKMNLPKYWYTTFLNTSLLKVSSNETENKEVVEEIIDEIVNEVKENNTTEDYIIVKK